MNVINLTFDKSETRIAGFPYGEAVYREQAEKNIIFGEKVLIVFPQQIEKIASSFVQGFFAEMVKNVGYSGIKKQVTIKAANQQLINDIWENIY